MLFRWKQSFGLILATISACKTCGTGTINNIQNAQKLPDFSSHNNNYDKFYLPISKFRTVNLITSEETLTEFKIKNKKTLFTAVNFSSSNDSNTIATDSRIRQEEDAVSSYSEW